MPSDLPIAKRVCQSTSRTLPDEVVETIFSEADGETVSRCQRLSHGWQSFLFSSRFAIEWCKKRNGALGCYATFSKPSNKKQFLLFEEQCFLFDKTLKFPSLSLDFLPEECQIHATGTHGLIVCSTSFVVTARYYICRPISQEWILLPNPQWRYETKSMGFAVSPCSPYRCKIVRLFHGQDSMYYNSEMLDTDRWRWISYKIKLRRNLVLAPEPPVLYKGSFHWMVDDSRFVFAFSIQNGTSGTITLPEQLSSNEDGKTTLTSIENRLVLLQLLPGAINLWFSNEVGNSKWEQFRKITLPCGVSISSSSIISFLYSDLVFVAMEGKCTCLQVLSDCTSEILKEWRLVCESDSKPIEPDHIYPFFTIEGPSNMIWKPDCLSSRNPTWSMRSRVGGKCCKKA